MSNDLFAIPCHDPLTIARKLDKIGDESRVRMRKGETYRTIEHKAAKLLRWYVSHNSGTRVAEQAQKLISEALRDKEQALTATWYVESQLRYAKHEIKSMTETAVFWRRMAFVATCLFVAATGLLTFVVVS